MKIDYTDDTMDKLDEKIILISLIGVFETLLTNCLSIDEAKKFLFSPHMIKNLRTQNCCDKIIAILEEGCELEDIASLIPDKLYKTINDLKQRTIDIAREYPEFKSTFWIQE